MTFAELKQILDSEPKLEECDEPECEKEVECKGKCNAHYLRARRLKNNPDAIFRPPVKMVFFREQEKTLAEWGLEYGICPTTIGTRLNRGWSVEEALTTPTRYRVDNSRPANK